MRLLLLVDSLRPSGATTQARRLAERLTERGIEPRLATLDARGGGPVGVNRRWRFDPLAAWRLNRLAAEFRPDAVHAWGAEAAGYAQAVGGARRVATLGAPPAPSAAKRIARHAHRVVATSGAVAAALPHGAPTLIPPGVAPVEPPGDEDRRALFAELNLPPSARLIAVAARMLPRKGVKELLWIADLVRVLCDEMRLVVVGEGPELPALHRFARMASDTEHIRLVGSRDDAARVLAAAEIVWHAGDELSPPVAVLEAMAAGAPVVADATPGAAHAITDGANGLLVEPKNRAARARATDRLLKDAGLRQQLAAAARETIASHFSADRMADAYAKLYRELAA